MADQDDRLARLEVLITEMDRRIELRFEQLEKRMVEGFTGVNSRIDDLNTRLLAIEGRLTLLESNKADKSTLNHWGVTLAALIGAGVALVKLWP